MKTTFDLKAVLVITFALCLCACIPEEDDEEDESDEVVFPTTLDTIPSANGITIDGNVDDWAGIAPLATDQSNDGGTYDGLDVTAIYLAQDADHLFIRVQMAGSTRPSDNEYHNYWIYFENNEAEFAIEAFHAPTIDARLWDITGADRQYSLQTEIGSMVANSSGDVIEVQVPKNLISTTSDYRVDFFTHHTINLNWENNGDEVADERGFVSFF